MILIKLCLLLNAAAALCFFVKNMKKGSKKYLSFFFLLFPGAGFLIYYVSEGMNQAGMIREYDRKSIVERHRFRDNIQDIDLKQNMALTPLEDVLTVGDKEQRRNMLFTGLKDSVTGNYKRFLRASNNEDTETAHYIASAKMSVFQELYRKFSRNSERYADDPCYETERELLLSMKELDQSELLSEEEIIIYRKMFCDVITDFTLHRPDLLEMYLESLKTLERYEELERVWKETGPEKKTEKMYGIMLDYCYSRNRKEAFEDCMKQLKRADFTLTAEGLRMLRFWEGKDWINA